MNDSILVVNRLSSRFQSNHHLGYFLRNTIISSGPIHRTPPAYRGANDSVNSASPMSMCPPTAAPTMTMGIARISRSNTESRFLDSG